MRPLATILLLTLCGCGHLTKVEAQDSGTYSCLLTDSGCVELPKPVTGHVNRVQLDHASMPPFDMAPKEWDETVMSCCPAIMRGGLCEMYPEGGCPDNSKGPVKVHHMECPEPKSVYFMLPAADGKFHCLALSQGAIR
jgi:hypothetical protein